MLAPLSPLRRAVPCSIPAQGARLAPRATAASCPGSQAALASAADSTRRSRSPPGQVQYFGARPGRGRKFGFNAHRRCSIEPADPNPVRSPRHLSVYRRLVFFVSFLAKSTPSLLDSQFSGFLSIGGSRRVRPVSASDPHRGVGPHGQSAPRHAAHALRDSHPRPRLDPFPPSDGGSRCALIPSPRARRLPRTNSPSARNAECLLLHRSAFCRRDGRPPGSPFPVNCVRIASRVCLADQPPARVPRPFCGRGARWRRSIASPPGLDPL